MFWPLHVTFSSPSFPATVSEISLKCSKSVTLTSALPCQEFVIERPEKFGGTVKFTSYQELEEAYAKEEVYPLDLKHGVTTHLNSVSRLGRGMGEGGRS